MSTEEDTELKNLVAQTLENKGVLPKIRAELRANVFLALEENPDTKDTLLKNDDLSAFLKLPIGSLILNLIREFLEFFELEFTLSVFDPETKFGKEYSNISREKMMKDLKFTESNLKFPLLYEIIDRLFHMDVKHINKDKSFKDLSQGDVSVNGENENIVFSPSGLNSTYVKGKPETSSVPVSPIEKEKNNAENESIKELVLNNISISDSISESKLVPELSPKVEDNIINSLNINNFNLPSNSLPTDPVEIDLLTFTPIKENKPTERSNGSELVISNETKTENKKEKQNSMSTLSDLPPLNFKTDGKGSKMSEIKAIIDGCPGSENEEESSVDSKNYNDLLEGKLSVQKSDRSDYSQVISQKSDRTEVADEFEEDISDLINGHTPSDNQLTVDETISKVSDVGDYLESL